MTGLGMCGVMRCCVTLRDVCMHVCTCPDLANTEVRGELVGREARIRVFEGLDPGRCLGRVSLLM